MDFAIRTRDDRAAKDARRYGKQLYHYTSLHTLFEIIKCEELWIGDTATMNDEMELRDFAERLKKAILHDFPHQRPEIKRLCESIDNAIVDGYPFAMCLTTNSDDAAQWERYADSATGACIIINTNTLAKLFHHHSGYLSEVFYGTDIRQHDHYRILSEHFANSRWCPFETESAWLSNLAATASSHKHLSFSTEKEIRMIVRSDCVDLYNNDGVFRVEYEFIRNQIKKVLKVNLDALCQRERISIEELFDGIILAPKSLQQINIFKEFLRDYEFYRLAENVHQSKCPLR